MIVLKVFDSGVKHPSDLGVLLSSVLMTDGVDDLALSEKALLYMDRKIKSGRNHWEIHRATSWEDEKSVCVVANFHKGVPYNVLKDREIVRKFHPIECERLMGVPDGHTDCVSNSQRYRMLGNGWSIPTVKHVLKGMLC